MDPGNLSHPEDREIGLSEFREMVAGKRQGFFMEKRYIRKNGAVFWGRITYSVVPDKDGNPQYLVGMIEDITEQKVAAENWQPGNAKISKHSNSASTSAHVL